MAGTSGWSGLGEGQRAFGLSPTPIADSAAPPEVHGAYAGEVLELSPAAVDAMQRLSRKVARQGGAILAIDYGYERTQTGETLQAVKSHAFAEPLDAPGEADISAHVNFGVLAEAAEDHRPRGRAARNVRASSCSVSASANAPRPWPAPIQAKPPTSRVPSSG